MRHALTIPMAPIATLTVLTLSACDDARMAGDNPILDAREAKDQPNLPPTRDNAHPLRQEPVPIQGPGAYGSPEGPTAEAPPEIPPGGVDAPQVPLNPADTTEAPASPEN